VEKSSCRTVKMTEIAKSLPHMSKKVTVTPGNPDNRCYISHTKEFIYIPIEKAACSSLKSALAPFFGIEFCLSEEARNDIMSDVDSFEKLHMQPFPTISKAEIFCESYRRYFKFAFVRNPCDRLASFFINKMQKRSLTNRYYREGIPRFLIRDYGEGYFYSGMCFELFVRRVCSIPDSFCEAHFRPQYLFLQHHGVGLPLDFLGRVEDLGRGFDCISSVLGIECRLERINSTNPAGDYGKLYTTELRDMVKSKYARDIALYGGCVV